MSLLTASARRRTTGDYPLPESATAAPWNSSTTPNIMPTYTGPDGATIHPSVVDMGADWNGYRWWQANTPYPSGVDDYENPSIWGSNDRITWTVPDGLTNPIEPFPGGVLFHSDTELTYDPAADRLVCYYRLANPIPEPPDIWLKAKSSPDGVTWTDHGIILTLPGGGARLSPAVWRIAPGQWRMWTWGNGAAAQQWTANDPLGPWTVAADCTLNGSPWTVGWHGDIILHNGTYYAIYSDTISSGNLWVTTSTDGIAWAARVQVMDGGAGGGWDTTLYRPTIIPSTVAGHFDCWYSAFSSSVPGGCATDYVRLPMSLWPSP